MREGYNDELTATGGSNNDLICAMSRWDEMLGGSWEQGSRLVTKLHFKRSSSRNRPKWVYTAYSSDITGGLFV